MHNIMDQRYHLLISNGGKQNVCIIRALRNSCFSNSQKQLLTKLFGDYIIESVHPAGIDCYVELDIVELDHLENYLKEKV